MELTKPVEVIPPKVEKSEDKEEGQKEENADVSKEEEVKPVKKPRAIVETDIFDFSDIKVVNKVES